MEGELGLSDLRIQWIVLLPIRIFPFMHLQLFDYSQSKLFNRQWLPKSHSYCRCHAIWHKWPCGRFLRWILVWPCQYRVVVLQLFVDIPVTPMSAAGFQRLWHPAGRQTMVKPEESPPSALAMREPSSSPNLARVSSTLRRVTGATRDFEPAWRWPNHMPREGWCDRNQRDTLPPNIWLPFSSSDSKFTNE